MSEPRSHFTYRVVPGFVLLVDEDSGGMSVTNDAENVVAWLARMNVLAGDEGRRRVLYRDSDGLWDELGHDGGRFTGFVAIRAISEEHAIAAIRAGLGGRS